MPILDAGAAGDDIFSKKAVFLILGILVERCPEQVRSNGVDRILMFIKESLNSDHPILLNGAIFAIARFVEHLKVDQIVPFPPSPPPSPMSITHPLNLICLLARH